MALCETGARGFGMWGSMVILSALAVHAGMPVFWTLETEVPPAENEVDSCPVCSKPYDPPLTSVKLSHGLTRNFSCPGDPSKGDPALRRVKTVQEASFGRVIVAKYSNFPGEDPTFLSSKNRDTEPGCPDLNVIDDLKGVCNGKVTECTFTASDPSIKPGCSKRSLFVLMECHRPNGARTMQVISVSARQ